MTRSFLPGKVRSSGAVLFATVFHDRSHIPKFLRKLRLRRQAAAITALVSPGLPMFRGEVQRRGRAELAPIHFRNLSKQASPLSGTSARSEEEQPVAKANAVATLNPKGENL